MAQTKKKPAARIIPGLREGVEMSLAEFATPAERERCRVLSSYQERLAAQHPAVRAAREKLLGGERETVTPERAFALLESAASRYMPIAEFAKLGVPWRDHDSVAEKFERRHEPEVADWEDVALWLGVRGAEPRRWPQRGAQRIRFADADGTPRRRLVAFSKADGTTAAAMAAPDTPLDWLAFYSPSIATDFLWTPLQAIHFVLTGEAPKIEPVSAHIEAARTDSKPWRVEVVLRFQPFISARTLSVAADKMRLALHRTSKGLPGRVGPPMRASNLALFEFVEEEIRRSAGKRPTLGALVEKWDRLQRPEWSYEGDRGHLWRDYVRVRRLLAESARWLDPQAAAEQRGRFKWLNPAKVATKPKHGD